MSDIFASLERQEFTMPESGIWAFCRFMPAKFIWNNNEIENSHNRFVTIKPMKVAIVSKGIYSENGEYLADWWCLSPMVERQLLRDTLSFLEHGEVDTHWADRLAGRIRTLLANQAQGEGKNHKNTP